MVVSLGALESGEKLFSEGHEFVEMTGSSRRRPPSKKEIKKIIKTWAEPFSRSLDAKDKLSSIKDGYFAVYFSNGDGKTFTAKYICQTNL